MGYGQAALGALEQWVDGILPRGGVILELGSQDINHDVPIEDIRRILLKIHRSSAACEELLSRYFTNAPLWKVADLFRDSDFRYRAIDTYPGDFIIEADLNTLSVSEEMRNSCDVVTNFGTTEHVADQINVFRVVHDLLRPGGYCVHSVPFAGYFNHGLYNYHPIFFVFLSCANEYEISFLSLSPPHLEYNIPFAKWFTGGEQWQSILNQSGIVSCVLQKVHNKPFALFTDYDRSVIAGREASILAEALEGRYDLRVRDGGGHKAATASGARGRFAGGGWLGAVGRMLRKFR